MIYKKSEQRKKSSKTSQSTHCEQQEFNVLQLLLSLFLTVYMLHSAICSIQYFAEKKMNNKTNKKKTKKNKKKTTLTTTLTNNKQSTWKSHLNVTFFSFFFFSLSLISFMKSNDNDEDEDVNDVEFLQTPIKICLTYRKLMCSD